MQVVDKKAGTVTFGCPTGAYKQKIETITEKAKKLNLTQNKKLDLIIEQNELILELLKPKGG